jgi:hypothetical protein
VWVAGAVVVYTLVGFLVVPLVAKRQIVAGVKKTLGCDAVIARIRFNPYTFNAGVRGFELKDRRGEPLASFDDLFVNLAPFALFKRVVALEEIRLAAPVLAVRIRDDRSMNLMELAPPAPADSAAAPPPAAWVVRVERLEVASMSVTFDDATVTPPAHAAIDSLDAVVTGFASVPGDTTRFETRLRSRHGGTVAASGFARALDGEVAARVDVDSLDVTPAAPYLARFAYLELRSGKLNVHGDVHAHAPAGERPDASFLGDIVIDDVELYDTLKQQDFFGFDRVAVLDARAQSTPPGARVQEITLAGIYARIAIAQDGSFNVNDVMAPGRAYSDSLERASGAPADTAKAAAPVPDIAVGRVRIDGGSIDFSDLSLPLPFAARVHSVGGEVTAIAPDNAAGSKLLIEGTVDEHGFAKASGFINVFDPTAFTDIDVSFRNIEMTSMTPYSGKFAGYQIKRGRLSLGLQYDIQRAQLKADHEILLEKLTLGDKIESPDAVSLPIKLAVALLKDKNGNIDLDLEVAGDLNDPKVNTASLIWQALKKIILKVAMAPFRFLGNLLGIGGDEMEFVEFEPGRKQLTPPQHERLGNLARALNERPALKLQVHGAFDQESDALALRTQRFETLLSQRLLAAAGGDTAAVRAIEGDPASGRMQALLETLVTEELGTPALANLRAAHTRPAAAPAPAGGTAPTAPAPAAAPDLDLAGYFKAMRDALIERQPVTEPELEQLAADRSSAIRGYLVEMQTIPPERVEIVEREVRDDGEDWIRCRLALEGTD